MGGRASGKVGPGQLGLVKSALYIDREKCSK